MWEQLHPVALSRDQHVMHRQIEAVVAQIAAVLTPQVVLVDLGMLLFVTPITILQ
jgi:hypothetical protein